MAVDAGQEVGPKAATPVITREKGKRSLPGVGLIKGLGVTMKHMLQRSITQEYPDEKPNLPPRTRGVIALKEENCTVCYKCSRECPDWCIYIDAHKETHEPAAGGRGRSVKVLDRFAIDYALCMYCGICVEVCPFDALFWAPDFEYAEYDILEMTHEMDRLQEWTYKVLPPPPLEEGAEPPVEEAPAEPSTASAEVQAPAAAPSVQSPAGGGGEAGGAPAPSGGPPTSAAAVAPAPAPPAPRAEHVEVEPDQETLDRVLQEELAKGTDRRVAEGRARAAAIRAARRKAEG